MKNKQVLMFLLCAILGSSLLAQADSRRDGRWETSFAVLYSDSEEVGGDNQSEVDIDNDFGIGFGVAYNLNQNIALAFDFAWLEPDYQAVFNTDESGLVSVDHEMDIYSGQFSAIWNIMDGPFTPFLRAGLGWTRIDSNVADGPPVTGCWWDPWFGYICQGFYDTYEDNSFSYSVGAGLRYEMPSGMLFKGSINRIEIDADNGFDLGINTARLEIGWMF